MCRGDGRVWRPSPVQLDHPEGKTPPWLQFRGRFGATGCISSEGFWKSQGSRCDVVARRWVEARLAASELSVYRNTVISKYRIIETSKYRLVKNLSNHRYIEIPSVRLAKLLKYRNAKILECRIAELSKH